MPPIHQTVIEPGRPAFLAALFVPKGSQYYLAVATLAGVLIEGTHFHLPAFAQQGFLFSLPTARQHNGVAVFYDWQGTVLKFYSPAPVELRAANESFLPGT